MKDCLDWKGIVSRLWKEKRFQESHMSIGREDQNLGRCSLLGLSL